MTSIEGHCQSACVGVYTNPTGPLLTQYSIDYKSCDLNSCCWVTHYYCLFPGLLGGYPDDITFVKTVVDGVESAVCDNTNPASDCLFLAIPNMNFSIQHSPCRATCNYGTYYP